MRLPCVLGLGIGLLALAPGGAALAQDDEPESRDGRGYRVFLPSAPGISLPTDFALARRLEAAHDDVQDESWVAAVRVLQALLDAPEDVLVGIRRAGGDGRDVTYWTGVRTEAGRLVAALPARGREFYEITYGPRAKALLTEANQKGDARLLAEVARRYFHTQAGADATRRLALYHLDRGRYHLAALSFGKLLERTGADRLHPTTLLAAVLAFRLAGNEARATQVRHGLATRANAGVRLGARVVDLDDLEKELTRLQAAAPQPPGTRGQAEGEGFRPSAALETRWTTPTAQETLAREWLQSALQREEERAQTILPASVPLAAGDRVVYRSFTGIQAVERATGKPVWESSSPWGLDRMAREPRFQPYLATWLNGYTVNNAHVLFANATLGGFSTDGARVYAVDDLPIPPFPLSSSNTGGRRRAPYAEPDFGPDLTDPAHHSRLLALDPESGKVVWEVGGRGEGAELNDSYFLGPPLPMDGHLYGVVEKNQELRLVCLDADGGRLRWTQPLATPSDKLLRDVARRIQPLRPVCAEGILVCPTNAGVVLGVDLFHRSLVWAYAYREEPALQEPDTYRGGGRGRYIPRDLARLREDWKSAGPVVHADRVVLSAPDASALHCLDLRSGAGVWKAERKDDDLYLAGVFGGKALVVGRQSCRALAVADGKELWNVETGLPSGRGIAAAGVYYLPLKSGVTEKQPAVYAIDVERGRILARTAAPRGEAPGNLVICGEDVLSQTVMGLTAYARVKSDKEGDK
jgi:outer membrane protein assembly factor BamB